MSEKDSAPVPSLEAELRQHLEEIETEETPERLLELAHALQKKLQEREKPN
ncbi:hypothetical protein E0K89_015620 [Aquicoccus sp. SCR17]|nr:hypothetical protein [Carideicomes alvinocaridis]